MFAAFSTNGGKIAAARTTATLTRAPTRTRKKMGLLRLVFVDLFLGVGFFAPHMVTGFINIRIPEFDRWENVKFHRTVRKCNLLLYRGAPNAFRTLKSHMTLLRPIRYMLQNRFAALKSSLVLPAPIRYYIGAPCKIAFI